MWSLIVTAVSFIAKASLVYAEASELPIEAATSTNPASDLLPTVVVILLGLIGLALVISGTRHPRWSRVPLHNIGSLFLSMRFSVSHGASQGGGVDSTPGAFQPPAPLCVGHLRDLSLTSASFVSPIYCGRGDRLQILLDSLPDFPVGRSSASAEVTACRSLGGDPTTFLVRVRFTEMTPAERYPLTRYLTQLARPTPIRHA